MSIEKLTDDERCALAEIGVTKSEHATERSDLLNQCDLLRGERHAAEARVRELEQALDAANALLKRSIPVMSDRVLREVNAHLSAQPAAPSEHRCGVRGFAACRAELARREAERKGRVLAAEARVRELEAENKHIGDACQLHYEQLAAANALPGRIWEALGELTSYLVDGDHVVKVDDVRRMFERHLSVQPASPTDHDRAVLEACAGLPEDMLREAAEENDFAPGQALARAELALREAER